MTVMETSGAVRVRSRVIQEYGAINFLFVLALAIDIATPFLIWKGVLPAPSRWISHFAIAAMISLVFARMLVFDRLPGIAWAVLGISVFGISVALLEGQSLGATAWGWWLFFQFPLVGLFAYLQTQWPPAFPRMLLMACISLLVLQVGVQIGQYIAGEPPGDNLAGLYAPHGTGELVIYILFVFCLAFGQWLAKGEWKWLVLALLLGTISSALGEIKFFPFGASAVAIIAFVLFVLRDRRFWKLISLAIFLGAVALLFVRAYDEAGGSATSYTRFLEAENLIRYVNRDERGIVDGVSRTDTGRAIRLGNAWNSIRSNTVSLMVGTGLGTCGESRIFGTEGSSVGRGGQCISDSPSLVVLMQELGLLGLAFLVGIFGWVSIALYRGIRSHPESESTPLRYGLLMFTVLLPLWIAYSSVWVARVPILFYWMALGYVLGTSRGSTGRAQPRDEYTPLPVWSRERIYSD